MRAADRRTPAEDSDLLAEHLKRVYHLSVVGIDPPKHPPRLPRDLTLSARFREMTVFIADPIPDDLPDPPPKHLGYYDIVYQVVETSLA